MCMGSGYVYHCPDCGETTYVALGIGSEYTPLKVFYGEDVDPPLLKDFLPDPQYRSAAFLLQNGGIPDTTHPGSYGQKLYYCPHCRTLKVKFFCTILKDGQPCIELLLIRYKLMQKTEEFARMDTLLIRNIFQNLNSKLIVG